MKLTFTILNGYAAGPKAGHGVTEFDTTLAEDVSAATKEFERLIGEGRTALVGGQRVTQMPTEGEVVFLIPLMGG